MSTEYTSTNQDSTMIGLGIEFLSKKLLPLIADKNAEGILACARYSLNPIGLGKSIFKISSESFIRKTKDMGFVDIGTLDINGYPNIQVLTSPIRGTGRAHYANTEMHTGIRFILVYTGEALSHETVVQFGIYILNGIKSDKTKDEAAQVFCDSIKEELNTESVPEEDRPDLFSRSPRLKDFFDRRYI